MISLGPAQWSHHDLLCWLTTWRRSSTYTYTCTLDVARSRTVCTSLHRVSLMAACQLRLLVCLCCLLYVLHLTAASLADHHEVSDGDDVVHHTARSSLTAARRARRRHRTGGHHQLGRLTQPRRVSHINHLSSSHFVWLHLTSTELVSPPNFSLLANRLAGKQERLGNWPFCVDWDVKP